MKTKHPLKNWTIYRLGDTHLCTINPQKGEISKLPDNTLVSFVPMAQVDEASGTMNTSTERPLGEVRKGYTYFAESDVVFAKITPCMENGKSAIARNLKNGIGFGTTEFHVLRAGKLVVIPEWLHLFVRRADFREAAKKNMHGAAGQQRVPVEFLKESEIPVPPLDEQRRIVARIEEITRRVEEARQVRQESLVDSATIFQRALENEFSNKVSKDWDEFSAQQIFDIVSGQVSPFDPQFKHLSYLGPEHIESGTGRIIGERRSVEELDMKSGKYHFTPEHVVYSKIRPALRKVCLPDHIGLCSADMYALKPNSNHVTREFLFFLLLAPSFSQYAVDNSDRNAMPKINRETLFGFTFRVPKKHKQIRIVKLLLNLRSSLDELLQIQRNVAEDLVKFQSALFAKAFRGEL